MKSLFFSLAVVFSAVLAVPQYGPPLTPVDPPTYRPPTSKYSRPTFIDGKKYNLEHFIDGTLLSYCAGCLVNAPAGVVAKDLPIHTGDWDTWTARVSGNTVVLEVSHASLQGGGPYTIKGGKDEEKGETITVVNNDKSSGKWTVTTYPGKECLFSLKDEQGRYLCAEDKSKFAYITPQPNRPKVDVVTKSLTDNCLFYAHRLS